MLDIKFVRDNLDVVKTMLKNRNNPLSLDGFTDLPIEDVTVKDISIMQCPTPLNIKRYKGLVLDNVTVAGEILTAPADY